MAKKLYNYIYKSRDRNYKLIINADSDVEAIALRDQLLTFYANDAARLEEMLQQNGIKDTWEPTNKKRKNRIEEVHIYRENREVWQEVKRWTLSGSDRELTNYRYDMQGNDQLLIAYVEGKRDKDGKKDKDEDKDRFCLELKDFNRVPNYAQKVTEEINRIIKESPALIASIDAYVDAFNREAGESKDPIQLRSLHSGLLKEHFGENFQAGNSVMIYLPQVDRDRFSSVEKHLNSVLIECPHIDDNPLNLPANTLNMTLLMFTVTRLSEDTLKIDMKIKRAKDRLCQLLKEKHDINAQDVYGRTALMYIAMGYRYFCFAAKWPGREEFTRLLLTNGADPTLRDHLGKTALDYFIAEVGKDHPATQLIRKALAARSKVLRSVFSPFLLEAQDTALPFKPKAEKSESESESRSESDFDSDSEESMKSASPLSDQPALYVYTYQAGDRTYKVFINAHSDAEATDLREQLLTLYVNHAARLEEMLQHQGITSNWGYAQSQREARLQEVRIYLGRQRNLQLIGCRILVGEDREQEHYGRQMHKDDQGLVVFVEGDNQARDEFDLSFKDFPIYAQQVTERIDRILAESPALIANIQAYVVAFNREAGVSKDPIQLESIRLRLLREHFPESHNSVDAICMYLDKIHADRLNSVEKRVEKIRIEMSDDNQLPANPWKMTPLMLAVIRSSEAGLFVDAITEQSLKKTRDLLVQGHDVNAQDTYGRTALMYVAMGQRYFKNIKTMPGREKLTRLLLENGADPSLKDHLGKTALDYFIAEVGEDHPATKLISEALAVRSMAALSISSSLPEPRASSDSIAAGGNRAFFPSLPAPAGAQNTVLPPSPKVEKAEASIAENFNCPITCEPMTDPVMAADGHSYQREAIEAWLKEHDTSPKTSALLPHKMLTPNWTLKATIDDYYKGKQATVESSSFRQGL